MYRILYKKFVQYYISIYAILYIRYIIEHKQRVLGDGGMYIEKEFFRNFLVFLSISLACRLCVLFTFLGVVKTIIKTKKQFITNCFCYYSTEAMISFICLFSIFQLPQYFTKFLLEKKSIFRV